MQRINLAFYCYPRKEAIFDFRKVARTIEAEAPDISVKVLSTASFATPLGTAALALRPTLSIEMDRIKLLHPVRGTRLRHDRMGKIEQLARLQEAGLPVPRWVEIGPDTKLHPADWGPYVVVKPSRGVRGAFVRISRTVRVRYKPSADFPEDHPGRKAPMLAQKFIYTGLWPSAFRVLTYLGRPLAAIEYRGRADLKPLEARDGFGKAPGSSIVASALGCSISCVDEPELLDLARRAHAVFPTIPSLGVDILRDARSGELHLIEVNPAGDSWMLCGKAGRAIQAQFGLDFYRQFDALRIIADTSMEAARRLAA